MDLGFDRPLQTHKGQILIELLITLTAMIAFLGFTSQLIEDQYQTSFQYLHTKFAESHDE